MKLNYKDNERQFYSVSFELREASATENTGWAAKCKKCNHILTELHPTKDGAKQELFKRGHTTDMCKFWKDIDL